MTFLANLVGVIAALSIGVATDKRPITINHQILARDCGFRHVYRDCKSHAFCVGFESCAKTSFMYLSGWPEREFIDYASDDSCIDPLRHSCFLFRRLPLFFPDSQLFIDFFPAHSNNAGVRKYLIGKHHKPDTVHECHKALALGLLIFNNVPCDTIRNQFCANSDANSGRFASISQFKFYLHVNAILTNAKIVYGTEFDGNPRPLSGEQSFIERVVSFPENSGAHNRPNEKKGSPENEPFGKASYRIVLPQPPPWLWYGLLSAAALCSLFSFVLLPDFQPTPTIRNRISLILYLLGITLAVAAIPAIIFGG